jgi:hypothetical protein
MSDSCLHVDAYYAVEITDKNSVIRMTSHFILPFVTERGLHIGINVFLVTQLTVCETPAALSHYAYHSVRHIDVQGSGELFVSGVGYS